MFRRGIQDMSSAELIREADETSEPFKVTTLYRLAIDQTGTISESVKRQLISMVIDSCDALNQAA